MSHFKNDGQRQEFDLWMLDNPTISFDEARSIGYGVGFRLIAKELFLSPRNTYERWLKVSGFGKFLDSFSRSEDEHYLSAHDMADGVLGHLYEHMKQNELELKDA